jgi:hypothetical protein
MAETFSIERFMDASQKVDLSDIDWSEVPKHPLTPEELRALRYFMITEGSTFFYVKALMQTNAVLEEPDFAPFLCVWMYEEEFHGRAFRKFIESYGIPVDATYRKNLFVKRGIGERIDEVGQVVLSKMFPDGWPAVHMVWGVIQEFTTYMAYQAIIERMNHPVLTTICQRIMKQELKHFAFYKSQAEKRLAGSKSAQRLATQALKVGWTPVGDGMNHKDDVAHAIRYLFDGLDGPVIKQIEKRVQELPGLEWFDLFSKFVHEHDIRSAPRSWMPRFRNAKKASPEALGAEVTT